ncbi:hypothetical protein EBR21_02885 [bacterium]|nr:hypothetical protein [bacterium]
MIRVPGWNHLLTGSNQPFPQWWVKDSFHLTRELGRFGSAAQLGAFFQLQEAQAQSASSDWSLITIKIFDQVHTPLVFALGKLTDDGKNTTFRDNANHPALNKASTSLNYLRDNGICDLCTDPRFAAVRFNNWFGQMLKFGTFDGKEVNTTTKNAGGYESLVGVFPSEVAVQTGIGLQRFQNFAVHNLVLTKVRPSLCDVNHLAGYKGLVMSPLGITAFMMGEQYDANGGEAFNVVYSGLSTNENTRFEVVGRSVGRLVQNIDQSLSGGFGDYRALESTTDKNLSYLFDKISVVDPKRRSAILQSREKVNKVIKDLRDVASNEIKTMAYPATVLGNQQSLFNDTTKKAAVINAKQEFLSQCDFVAKSLKIDGKPYRNFSLFLNVNDLDGAVIDDPINGIASPFNALNYVEGMRQLAMGLNILANATKGTKTLILVVSDGGRTRDMGDGSGSCFAMLFGPKGDGGLDDALHGPLNIINSGDYQISAPLQRLGELGAGLEGTAQSTVLEWTSGGNTWGLRNNNGTKATGQAMVGDWQVGVLQFLAEAQGRNVMAPELEKYVRFKRYNQG